MKTKNFLLTGALLIVALFSVNGVMAKTPTNTDKVTVNIKFKPIQTIEVNENEVEFLYDNIAKYENGAENQIKKKHLKINSSGPFVVNVVSTDFAGGLSGKTIPLSDVAVQVVNTTTERYTGAGITTSLPLSATKTPLFTSTGGGMNLEFDVTYSNPGGKNGKYLEGYLKGEEVTYTAQVTYEIIAN